MTTGTGGAPLWLLTGLSGAGRRTALEALGQAGVACTDNLPLALLEAAVRLPRASPEVVAVDARQGDVVASLVPPPGVRVLFLDAEDGILVRRLADSVAPHPCAAAGNGLAAVVAERALLAGLRGVADAVVDSGELTTDELGRRVVALVRPEVGPASGMVVTVSSFGFKHGPQVEADWVVDVRFLPNPFWVAELRPLTGLDPRVRAHVFAGDDAARLVDGLGDLADWSAARFAAKGRLRFHVALGCTGGRHRSVAVAQALAERLRGAGLAVELRHRDVELPDPR